MWLLECARKPAELVVFYFWGSSGHFPRHVTTIVNLHCERFTRLRLFTRGFYMHFRKQEV